MELPAFRLLFITDSCNNQRLLNPWVISLLRISSTVGDNICLAYLKNLNSASQIFSRVEKNMVLQIAKQTLLFLEV